MYSKAAKAVHNRNVVLKLAGVINKNSVKLVHVDRINYELPENRIYVISSQNTPEGVRFYSKHKKMAVVMEGCYYIKG